MSTICGHEREALIWALSWARDVWADDDTSLRELATMPWSAKNPARYAIIAAIIDPAKLVEMLAARGRELGFFVGIAADIHCRSPIFGARSTDAKSIKVWVRPVADDPSRPFDREFTMPQARVILLQWLQFPDGDRVGAEQALRDTQ